MGVEFLDEETETRPSLANFLGQGVVRGVANTVAPFDQRILASPDGGFHMGPDPNPLADRVRRFGTSVLGPRVEPRGLAERTAETVGAGGAEMAPFLPLAFLPGPGGLASRALPRIGGELAASIAGRAAGDLAHDLGAGPVAEGAASLAGSFSPAIAARALGGLASSTGQAVLTPLRNRVARAAVRERLGRQVTDRATAIERLREEADTNLFGRATTNQVLMRQSPGVEGEVRKFLKGGPPESDVLRSEVAELRRLDAIEAVEFGRKQFPSGSAGSAQRVYVERLNEFRDKVRRAYENVDDLAGVPTDRLKATRALVLAQAGDELSEHIPRKVTQLIDRYGETTNLRRVTRLRTKIGEAQEIAKRQGKKTRAFYLGELKDAVDATLDDVARVGGAEEVNALRRAIGLRRAQRVRFDPQDKLNQLLESDSEDLVKGFGKFLNQSPTPSKSLLTLRGNLIDDGEAWGGVQQLMHETLFGRNFERVLSPDGDLLSPGGAMKVIRDVRRHAKSIDVVYGPGSAEAAESFLKRVRKISAGVLGKVDEFAVTGSNVPEVANAGILQSMAMNDFRGAAFKAYRAATGQSPKTAAEADRLFRAAIFHPADAVPFLEEVTPEALNLWARRVNQTRLALRIPRAAGSPLNRSAPPPSPGESQP